MFRKPFSFFRITAAVISLFFGKVMLQAEEARRVEPLSVPSFETVFDLSGSGLEYVAFGKSFLKNGALQTASTIDFQSRRNDLLRFFLVWAGQYLDSEGGINGATLAVPGGASHNIQADNIFRTSPSPTAFVCVKDVTALYAGPGKYTLTGVRSDPGQDGRGMAGWVLVAVSGRAEKQGTRRVVLKAGIQKLRPLEYYRMDLHPAEKGWHLRSITVIGGHGKEGNAGATLVNGLPLSGGDDWNGSSGEFWDVDTYALSSKPVPVDAGLQLVFDPLIQWIYPTSVIYELEQVAAR